MSEIRVLQMVLLIGTVISISTGIGIPSGIPVTHTAKTLSDGITNGFCQKNGTGLLCNVIAIAHKITQNLPAVLTIRHCSIFLITPHCCDQFCPPGVGGSCDGETGACFCKPSGLPRACEMLIKTDDGRTTPGMNRNDLNVLDICKTKCQSNTAHNCTKSAAVTDGIVGSVCFCYCDPPSK